MRFLCLISYELWRFQFGASISSALSIVNNLLKKNLAGLQTVLCNLHCFFTGSFDFVWFEFQTFSSAFVPVVAVFVMAV